MRGESGDSAGRPSYVCVKDLAGESFGSKRYENLSDAKDTKTFRVPKRVWTIIKMGLYDIVAGRWPIAGRELIIIAYSFTFTNTGRPAHLYSYP